MPDATTTKPAQGYRARVRAELTAEIKAAATRQLEAEGATSLSLRAIAREMGMASSAIYRYFPSRDDLLTALIVDAYNDVGERVEGADASQDRSDHSGRFVAVARSIRRWAVDNPHQYALIYGSPIPGYAAPQDTIDPAIRVPVCLMTILVDAKPKGGKSKKLDEALAGLLDFTGHSVAPVALARAVQGWGEIMGLISLEMFGHFENAVTEPAILFDHAMAELADRVVG